MAGVYFCGLAVFCVLRELIFAIRKHCFFPLGINFFASFKKNPAFIIFSILLNVFVIIIIINFIIININETPSELLRENLISSHEKITCISSRVKISPLLWLHNKPHLSGPKTI